MNEKDKELQVLRNRVSELEAKKEADAKSSDPGRTFFKELEEIKRKGKNTAGEIKYKDINDHTPIPLWRKDGKMIGPLHPANAERTFKDFYNLGIILSVSKPTAAEISAYKETAEYKNWKEKEDRINEKNRRSLKGNAVEKLTEQIAKVVGVPAGELNRLRKPQEVGV